MELGSLAPIIALCKVGVLRRPVMAETGSKDHFLTYCTVVSTRAVPTVPTRAKPALSLKSSEVSLARAQAIMARMLAVHHSATTRLVQTSRLWLLQNTSHLPLSIFRSLASSR